MKLMPIAILLIRLACLPFFIDAFIILTELPTLAFGMYASQFRSITFERDVALLMVLVRLCFYVIGGTCFLVFARPLAKLFTKGLDENH